MQHQFAAVAPTDGSRPAAAPAHLLSTVDARRAGSGRWERATLLLTDVTTMAALSIVAGSTAPATATRTALCVVLFAVAGLYRPRLHFSPLDDVTRALLCMVAVLPLGAWWKLSTLLAPPWFKAAPFLWPLAMFGGFLISRAITYKAIHGTRRRTIGASTVVVGTGSIGLRVAEVLREDPAFGLCPVGVVGPAPVTGEGTPVRRLGDAGDLDVVIAEHRPDAVVVTFPGTPDEDLVGTLRECRRLGVTVFVVPRLFDLAVRSTELVHGIPLVRLPARRGAIGRAAKRVVDVAGAATGLLLLSPVLLVCALLVRAESLCRRGRPPGEGSKVIFRQERIGQDDRPFTIMKFRSLTPSSDLESQVRWNINNDARVGRLGRLLRNSSLDELPQLLNVLRGDMSLVGPRPERPFFVEQFRRTYTGYGDRHRMPVGITGWAQIHGLRGDTSIEERTRFDNYYIENWSLGLDLKIIARTVGSMLSINRK